jgi:putrescine importer
LIDESETSSELSDEQTTLRRALGLPGLTFFGLAYLSILAVFTVYGSGVKVTDGHLPAAYIVATVAMLFTAYSYGRMSGQFPRAGSAYTYTQQTFGGHVGFLTGWTLMLDYLFLPMINFLLIGLYLNAQFPAVPAWAFTLFGLAFVLGLSILGIRVVSRINVFAVITSAAVAVVFIGLSINYGIRHSSGVSILAPLIPGDGGVAPIFAGAAILALAFLGFDAVSTMSEEARHPKRDIPRAIMLTTILGGLTFFLVAWAGTFVFPDWTLIQDLDAAGVELNERVGGPILQALFVAIYIVGATLSGTAAQISVARILYAMGRDGVLPHRLGYLHPRFRTPVVAALVVSAFSLVALFISLDVAVTIINFGALAAFSMVNLSVIKHFIVDREERTPKDLLRYGLVPAIGFALTVWIWTSLSGFTFVVGLCWMAAGVIVLAIRTRFFRVQPPVMDFSEAAQ